jgi:hypothetical protein
MKSPPVQYSDAEAHDLVEDFIADATPGSIPVTSNGNGHRNGVSLEVESVHRNP